RQRGRRRLAGRSDAPCRSPGGSGGRSGGRRPVGGTGGEARAAARAPGRTTAGKSLLRGPAGGPDPPARLTRLSGVSVISSSGKQEGQPSRNLNRLPIGLGRARGALSPYMALAGPPSRRSACSTLPSPAERTSPMAPRLARRALPL